MTSAPSLTRQILNLALPALGALIAEPLFILIDSAMVGHLGTAELAGLGLASTIVQTLVGLFVFLLFSTTTQAARALGEGKLSDALSAGINAVWLALLLGLTSALILTLGAHALIGFFGPDPTVIPHAVDYLRYSAPGVVGMFIVMALTGVLRGLHDTTTALKVASLGALFNTGANAVFIYGLSWGVAGSAVGTSLTQLLMAAALLRAFLHRSRGHELTLRPRFAGIFGSARDGVPYFVRTLALRLSLLALLTAATGMGVTALAAHQIVWSLWSFASYAFDALAVAGQTLFATAAGRGDHAASQLLLRRLSVWGVGAGLVLGSVFALASPLLPMFFSSDEVVRAATTAGLLVAAVGMPIASAVFLFDGVMMGADRARFLAGVHVGLLAGHVPLLWMMSPRMSQWPANWSLAGLWAEWALLFMGARLACLMWGLRDEFRHDSQTPR